METIAYTSGGTVTEISFTALGVGANPRVTYGTHGPSKFSLPLPGVAPETAAVIPFEASCTLYTGRTGGGGSWSGGTKLFQGRRSDNSGEAAGGHVSSELVIEDAWYDLRFLTLQAVWTTITGGTMENPVYGASSWPDCVLFQATPGTSYTTFPSPQNVNPVEEHITTGQAIIEILQYAIACGVNLQIGTVSPNLYVPFYPCRAMRCADAIKLALRSHPDAVTEIDYTTTPPTFNVRLRAGLTTLTLPYHGAVTLDQGAVTQTHLTSTVQPRPDLIPTRVGIYIKTLSTIAGQQVVSLASDIYPNLPAGLRSFDTSLDLSGPKTSLVTAQLTTYAFTPADLSFWTTHVPALNSTTHLETVPGSLALVNTAINDGSLNCITVLDANGEAVDLSTFAYVMGAQGTAHAWMQLPGNGGPVQVVEATVTGHLTYQRRKNLGTVTSPVWVHTGQPNSHEHPVKVKLCNVPAGTTTFYLEQLLSAGEYYPAGLAENLYNALTPLQYQFVHTILEQPFTTVIKPGKHTLNLSGGATAWQTMNAMVQEVTLELISASTGLTSSKTTIKCGPVAHLEPGQLVQLTNAFGNRDFSRINPNERTSGLVNGGLNAAMPDDTAKENTTLAQPDAAYQIFSAPAAGDSTKTNSIQNDPANGQWLLNQLVNSTGAVNAAAPSVTIAQADLIAGGTTNLAAKFQVVSCCQNDGTVKKFAVLCTNPE